MNWLLKKQFRVRHLFIQTLLLSLSSTSASLSLSRVMQALCLCNMSTSAVRADGETLA